MAAKQSGLNGIYFVALTLLGIECAYRLAYWFWMVRFPQSDAHAAWTHLYVWLPISAVVALLWALIVWRWYQEEMASRKKPKKAVTSSK